MDVDNDSVAGTSEELHSILIDSGADASIFPAYLLGKGQQVVDSVGKLCDAQGVEIPIAAVQDMEIRLKDLTGRTILLRERVAVSDKVGQPILCFGHLLESGWGIDANTTDTGPCNCRCTCPTGNAEQVHGGSGYNQNASTL